MSGVDVLTVMEMTSEAIGCEGYACPELDQAIDAVAELIEACDYLKRDASNEQWAAFHSALRRVKGEG